MNKSEVCKFLEYVFTLPVVLPMLRDLADLSSGKDRGQGPIKRRLERFYMRLCCLQSELGRLDLKRASLGATLGVEGHKTLEEYVFNQVDFSRYKKIAAQYFEKIFPEALADFEGSFFKSNFGLGKKEIKSVIEESYLKAENEYHLQKENPLILSIMRTLETSLETVPLFSAEEIEKERLKLPNHVEEKLPGIVELYPVLVSSLDKVTVTHSDGMTTKLFISPTGDLSATFQPGGKPWTCVVIKK